jgi:hypothetical protein
MLAWLFNPGISPRLTLRLNDRESGDPVEDRAENVSLLGGCGLTSMRS